MISNYLKVFQTVQDSSTVKKKMSETCLSVNIIMIVLLIMHLLLNSPDNRVMMIIIRDIRSL